MKENVVHKLAAYSTIKSMVDSEKYPNQYYILAEFIKYVISSHKKYSFSSFDIIAILKEEFEFEIPYAVIKSSLKKISNLKKCNDVYTLTSIENVSNEFIQFNEAAEIEGKDLINKLRKFCLDINADKEYLDSLEIDFIKYVLDQDDVHDLKCGDLISRFFISIEKDKALQEKLEKIREGSLIYCGLCYNIIETGSITNNMTLYFDTEILFFLAGYNGKLSQRIALDLIGLIRKANEKKKRISLSYFCDVKKEIDRYFGAAKNIVTGKGGSITSRAMQFIVDGCASESDVIDKQTDFYYSLENRYGIRMDDKSDIYYKSENFQFNMETKEPIYDEDSKSAEAIRYISHINVLRKGQEFDDYMRAGHIVITQTHKLLSMSEEVKPYGKVGYAISLGKITNILWMKLGSMFRKEGFPCNIDIAVKARMVLDKSISSSISKTYAHVLSQYKDGILDEELTAARLLRLQEKIIEPESISESNINDLMDFSEESLQKYEDAIRLSDKEIEKRNKIISEMKNIQKNKDDEIQKLNRINKESENLIREQDSIIQEYKEKENRDKLLKEQKEEKRDKRISVSLFLVNTTLLVIIFAFLPTELVIARVLQGVSIVIGIYGSICTIHPEANLITRIRGKQSKKDIAEGDYFKKEIKKFIKINICVFILCLISILIFIIALFNWNPENVLV